MFGKSKSNKATGVQSIIGSGTMILGNINFSGGLRIDGVVQGNIKSVEGSHSMLYVSEQAKIDGEIHASHIVINGTLNGPVYATQLVELEPKARVKGDVIYNAIEMHHGAVVSGNLKHHAYEEPLSLPSSNQVTALKNSDKTDSSKK